MTDFERIKKITDHYPTGLSLNGRRKHMSSRDLEENSREQVISINKQVGDYEVSFNMIFDLNGNLTDIY